MGRLLCPGIVDGPVVSVVVWQRVQPMGLKTCWPCTSEAVWVVGAGAAESRMKKAKLMVSDDSVLASPTSVLLLGLRRLVLSSGVALPTQAPLPRSLGKSSLVTPCSTL